MHDLNAVANDVRARGLCFDSGPVAYGESNGGLTATAAGLLRPDLWAGVVAQNAILDVLGARELDPDAWWHAEFGDPTRPEVSTSMRGYSPMELVKSADSCPPMLVIAGKNDAVVSPEHSLRFVRKVRSCLPETRIALRLHDGGHGQDWTPRALQRSMAEVLAFAHETSHG